MDEIYEITIIQKALEQICNEMTITLKKTAFSPNIKERLDFSCALFNATGDLMASKEGIPVHLGSMEDAVKFVINKFKLHDKLFDKGDVIVHNNPNEGGTHLPDINLIMPIFTDQSDYPIFYASCRAHHADVGGKSPGSMPSYSETLFEEGIQIPGIKLWSKGVLNEELLDLLLTNVRTPKERKGDFYAQRSALLVGERRILALIKKYSLEKLMQYIAILIENSNKAMEQFLQKITLQHPVNAVDYLDSDGSSNDHIRLEVTLTKTAFSKLQLDFTGSSDQRFANCNATSAITKSCSYFVFRYLLSSSQGDLATNSGLWKPLSFKMPTNSIVNSSYPFATSSGNVETSQRIVDLLFKALSKIPELELLIPAASQGTMNNITIGGLFKDTFFSYYETIAGGSGAISGYNGISGVHTNMTNTLNTPIEAFELSYPLRITKYELRKNSGGKGLYVGGDGLIREYEILCDRAHINVQSERRLLAPYGLFGGSDGLTGENVLQRKDNEEILLGGRFAMILKRGEKIKILTPGGGGYKKEAGVN